jgi:multidrug efflux system membrane fusion protein
MAEGSLPVEALGFENRGGLDGKPPVIDNGRVQVIDNQVDPTTGTVRLKAEFPNQNLQLWPGQFVNVRLLIDTLQQVVVVSTSAVQRGPTGTFVFVIDGESRARRRNVRVSQQDDLRAVVVEGLSGGERVVTSGFARIAEGSEVEVTSTEEIGKPPAIPKVEPQSRRERGKKNAAKSGDQKGETGGEQKGEKRKGRGANPQGSEAKSSTTQ